MKDEEPDPSRAPRSLVETTAQMLIEGRLELDSLDAEETSGSGSSSRTG
jgi:hypothetical protein